MDLKKKFFFFSEICGLGEEASYRTLLTVCSIDEFTCSDGDGDGGGDGGGDNIRKNISDF